MAAAFPRLTVFSRRSFTAAAAATLSTTMVHSSLAAADGRELRIGVIGCGGRGSGAIHDSLSINEGVALVAVMGRMAAYTGQKVSWNFLTEESQLDLFPKDLTWKSSLPRQAPAVPGKTKLI